MACGTGRAGCILTFTHEPVHPQMLSLGTAQGVVKGGKGWASCNSCTAYMLLRPVGALQATSGFTV